MKIVKNYFFYFLVLSFQFAHSQDSLLNLGRNSKVRDTVSLKERDLALLKDLYKKGFNIFSKGKNKEYYYLDKRVSHDEYYRMAHFSDSIQNIILSCVFKYCKFYDDNGMLVEEGILCEYSFTGNYKKYFTNGILEEEGAYTSPDGPYLFAQKIGIWKYYNKKGKLKRKIEYFPERIIK